MKQSSLAAKLLEARARFGKLAPSANGQHSPRTAGTRRWLHWAIASLLVLGAGAGTFAVLHFAVLTRLPSTMLGKWLVVGGEMDGATLEFQRDGAMVGKVNMAGKEGKIQAKVEVDGETLRITSINPSTNRPETDVQTIHTLTAERFVIEDRKGTVLNMERLKE
jgi:uncharacterized protein (TIGR03066 family)